MATSDRPARFPGGAPTATHPDDRREEPWLAGSELIDQALLDRDGRRAGRVDDLVFEVTPGQGDRPPRVELQGIVSGPLPRPMSGPFVVLRVLARLGYLLVGIRDPHPAVVEWRHVTAIDALVHLDLPRAQAGLTPVDAAVGRLIRRVPGANREH